MLKKSPFYDFLNRREDTDFHQYPANSVEDADFIDWNSFLLPNDYGDAVAEYRAIRESCAMFDVSTLRKYRITGVGSGAFLDWICFTGSFIRNCHVSYGFRRDRTS